MRATSILQAQLREGVKILHAKQWSALWRAVTGLAQGGQLWLTALRRSLPGATADKHRIKAADRLLGNAAIQGALPQLYAVLAAFKRKCSPKAEHEFLTDLVGLVPRHCCPILVSDAGFHMEWLDAVRGLGWDFVGRLRGRKKALRNGQLVPLEELHALAGKRPKCLGLCGLRSRKNKTARPFRLVLSAKPKVKGRHRMTSLGTKAVALPTVNAAPPLASHCYWLPHCLSRRRSSLLLTVCGCKSRKRFATSRATVMAGHSKTCVAELRPALMSFCS